MASTPQDYELEYKKFLETINVKESSQNQEDQQESVNFSSIVNIKNVEIEQQKQTTEQNKQLVCNLHPHNPSQNCRNCQKIQQQKAIENAANNSNNKNSGVSVYKIETKKIEFLSDFNQPYIKIAQDTFSQQELIQMVPKGDRNDNVFKLWGQSPSVHMNQRLKTNILNCLYFKELYNLRTYHEVIDEISKNCSHAEPWIIGGGGPSTMFCCLYQLMLMSLTVKQIKGLIDYKLSGMVRCCGFLYIRFASHPLYIYAWLHRYLLDDEEIKITADNQGTMTIGEFVEQLLMDLDYFQTRFPRIPISVEQQIKAQLVMNLEQRERKRKNLENISLFMKDSKVRAISSQDREWHEGEIERMEGKQILVRFYTPPDGEYSQFQGGEEAINLGEVELVEKAPEVQILVADSKEKIDVENDTLIEKEQHIESKSDQREKKSGSRSRKISRSSSESASSSSSSQSSASDSYSDSRSRSRSTNKHKQHQKRKDSKQQKHQKDKKRKADKQHKEKSSKRHQNSKSRSNSPVQKQQDIEPEKEQTVKRSSIPQQEVQQFQTNRQKEEKILMNIKKEQAQDAVAVSKMDVANMPKSFKKYLDTQLPKATNNFQRPQSNGVVYKQEQFVETIIPSYVEAQEREQKEKEQEKHKSKISEEEQALYNQLREQYGDAAAQGQPAQAGGYDASSSNDDQKLDEGPQIYKLG